MLRSLNDLPACSNDNGHAIAGWRPVIAWKEGDTCVIKRKGRRYFGYIGAISHRYADETTTAYVNSQLGGAWADVRTLLHPHDIAKGNAS